MRAFLSSSSIPCDGRFWESYSIVVDLIVWVKNGVRIPYKKGMAYSAADKGMQRANFQQRFFWSDFFSQYVVLVEQDLIFFLP